MSGEKSFMEYVYEAEQEAWFGNKKSKTKTMTKETALEKLKAISDKQELNDAIETYHELGNHIHERIDEHQKQLGEELNHYQTEKSKIKPNE